MTDQKTPAPPPPVPAPAPSQPVLDDAYNSRTEIVTYYSPPPAPPAPPEPRR